MKNQTFDLTLITPEDAADLSELMLRVWGFETHSAYWRWKYFDPPFETRGYAVKSETGKIVAFTGFWLRPARVSGSCHRIWQVIDIMADPEYRSGKAYKVIARKLDDLFYHQNKILLGFTNDVSYAFFSKYFNDVLIINEVKKIQSLIIDTRYLLNGNKFLANIIGMANRWAIKTALVFSKPSGHFNIARADKFFDDINELCKDIENQYDFILMRDVDYLNWRFLSGPHQNFQVWTARKNGRLVGYMVTVLRKRSGKKLKGEIVDWMTPRRDLQVFKALLHHALNWFVQEKANVVEIWSPNLDNRLLKLLKMNLFIEGRRNKSFLAGTNRPEKFNIATDPGKDSFFTTGDAD